MGVGTLQVEVPTEVIWHHQPPATAELPVVRPAPAHPHRRRVLASLYSSCGVLGLLIGVTIAELSAVPPPIPPAAVAPDHPGVRVPADELSPSAAPSTSRPRPRHRAPVSTRPLPVATRATPARESATSAPASASPTPSATPTSTQPTTEPTIPVPPLRKPVGTPTSSESK